MAAALAFGAGPSLADDPPPASAASTAVRWLNLSGSIRLDYFSSSRSLDGRSHLAGGGFYLRVAPRVTDRVSAVFDGWVRNASPFEGEPTHGKVREAFIDLGWGPLDVRIGKQLIVWGRADRINPTDNLTPRDFTLLVPEDDDQRSGTTALKATLHEGGLAFTGIWIPVFEPDVIPFAARPGIVFREITPAAFREQEGAVKIDQTGKRVDWSLSYFDGLDLLPDLGVGRVLPLPAVEVLLRHHHLRVLGADVATLLGRFGARAEAAYTFTEDPEGDDPEVKNPFFFLVAGMDRTVLQDLTVSVQYLFRAVTHFHDPAELDDPLRLAVATEQAILAHQLDRFEHQASARVGGKWLNETLEAEVTGLYGFTRSDYAVRAKVIYALNDRLKGTVGADVFRGPRVSFFGRIRDASTVFAEMKFSF
jgi:hypothetical protein